MSTKATESRNSRGIYHLGALGNKTHVSGNRTGSVAPVLVGFDCSRDAYAALRWGQDEAARRGVPLRLAYVYEWSTDAAAVPQQAGWPDPTVRAETVSALEEAVIRARRHRPEVLVEAAVVDGTVIPALAKLSEQARLLVLGSRGLGGFNGLLAGSVAVGLASYAQCQVVVARGAAPARRPVLVGLDEAADGDGAVGSAFDQAAARGVGLVAVRAWQPPPVPYRSDTPPPPYDVERLQGVQRDLAERAVAAWREKYPDVPVTVRLLPGTGAHALITASQEAQLVVVGCRGRGGFRGLPLGSVASQLIHHAHCPVAMVRGPAESMGG